MALAMVDISASTDMIDERDDLGDGDPALWAFWMGQDRIAGKKEDLWAKRGEKIIKRYRDERGSTDRGLHRLNILWSNVQTLIPTLYARTPKADVRRRFLDEDDTGRYASLLLERCLAYALDQCSFDDVMKGAVEDRLLPGRGTARVVYIPHFGEPLPPIAPEAGAEGDPSGEPDPEPPEAAPREVVFEEAAITYLFWGDYREGPARTWREVPWVRYQSYMTKDELIKRFGQKGKRVNLDHTPPGAEMNVETATPPDIFKKARVFEFWDKSKKEVVWLAPGTPDLILDKQADPLCLPDFFPSPNPLLATTTTESRIPVPDYAQYQDQADAIDNLTARIDVLTRALKLSGVYPGVQKDILNRLISADTENQLIPVEDWNGWQDKGGLASFIQWMPIKEVAETLVQLYAAREKTKDLLYEVTGIGDIMRGQTSPNETLGAQQLKANFSTRRIKPQQTEVARFARDLIRLVGGVVAEHFAPETISAITGYPQLKKVPQVPPAPPMWVPAPMPPPQMMAPPQPQMPMGAPQ